MTLIEHAARCLYRLSATDLEFTVELSRYGIGRTRYVCVAGHSVYEEIPELTAVRIQAARPPNSRERVCQQCGTTFTLPVRMWGRYCTPRCRAEYRRVYARAVYHQEKAASDAMAGGGGR